MSKQFKKMIELYPQATFLITLGSLGSVVANKNILQHFEIKKSQNPVDSTGAGDAFIAYIINEIAKFENPNDWTSELSRIINGANEFAKKSIEYKGALTFLDN
ncbi:PfkB family carbohydrate kinase [Spiroplasma clarkii]|uniref:PfkB family carbohydrate kinase n=1 Tax=Spiroplasma clarkii TaxID=2139 RepID=UPI00214F7808|nr:PfkB family carbohydrate kinase [Spiroplasma clarkii]